jgi:hypothetical protein
MVAVCSVFVSMYVIIRMLCVTMQATLLYATLLCHTLVCHTLVFLTLVCHTLVCQMLRQTKVDFLHEQRSLYVRTGFSWLTTVSICWFLRTR